MTAKPSSEKETYTKQTQKFRFWGKLLFSCKLDSSIIWIRLPGKKEKKKKKQEQTGKNEAGIWFNVYTTCYHKGCELNGSKMLQASKI